MNNTYVLTWMDAQGNNTSRTIHKQNVFLKELEEFFSKGQECRVVINSMDHVTKNSVEKLFEKYHVQYNVNNESNALLEGLKGVVNGTIEASTYTGIAVAGMTVVQLSSDELSEIATHFGHEVTLEFLAENLNIAADFLSVTGDMVSDVADNTTRFLGPIGMIISGVIKGYRMYRKSKKADKSYIVYTFKNPRYFKPHINYDMNPLVIPLEPARI